MTKYKRILVGKLQRSGKQPEIGHDEVAQALRRFKERGGLIKELPPQRASLRQVVGNQHGSPYETVIDRS